jgi:hypothetical protein
MPINSYKLGPGTLTLGAGALEVSAQVTACVVSWEENLETTPAIPVLSGEEIAEEDEATYKAKLEVTFLQDLAVAGVVDWSWTNKGTEQPFDYVPNTVTDRAVNGVLVPTPLAVGGSEMKKRPTSDATWRIIGEPDLEDATP